MYFLFQLQTILFTTDEKILESISRNDESFMNVEDNLIVSAEKEMERPITGATDISVSIACEFFSSHYNLDTLMIIF